jgi:hypothetical protein
MLLGGILLVLVIAPERVTVKTKTLILESAVMALYGLRVLVELQDKMQKK